MIDVSVILYRTSHTVLVPAPSSEDFVTRFARNSRTFHKTLQYDPVILLRSKENKAWNSYGCPHPIVTHLCEKEPSVKTANFSHMKCVFQCFYKMISNKMSCVWCIWHFEVTNVRLCLFTLQGTPSSVHSVHTHTVFYGFDGFCGDNHIRSCVNLSVFMSWLAYTHHATWHATHNWL